MSTFQTKTIRTWNGFLRLREKLQDKWVFRGQTKDWELKSSFERACDRDDVSLDRRSEVETELITDFRRRYDGKDRQIVNSDTLYCLALMQHYGAPTRLIDFTYSPFIALYFALEASEKSSVVWCINHKQCLESAYAIAGKDVIEKRNCYNTRNDHTFLPLYIEPPLYNMVFLENPFFFNPRLNVQQGLFLCPGNICASFDR
jgi:hypothetical protein